MKTRLHRIRPRQRAVTLTELLVVIAIIGLLATLAIPVFLRQMELARFRTAQLEVKEIALAEQQCAILHTWYVPLQVLDDIKLPEGTDIPPADSLLNESRSNIFLIDPMLPSIAQAQGLQFTMDSPAPRVFNVFDPRVGTWQGPFINVHRAFNAALVAGFSRTPTSEDVRRDFPLDPWGQPYRFYSPVGVIGTLATDTSLFNMNTDSFSDGRLFVRSGAYDPVDRYAIGSLGPNQAFDLPGDLFNDDIIYEFGFTTDLTAFLRFVF